MHSSNHIPRRLTSGGGLKAGELGWEAAEENGSQQSMAFSPPGRMSILIVSHETEHCTRRILIRVRYKLRSSHTDLRQPATNLNLMIE